MGQEITSILQDSSAEIPGGSAEPQMLFARSIIVPRNSGVQNVFAMIQSALLRAQNFKPPYRKYGVALVNARKLGLAAISSEGGDMLKAINTTRTEQMLGAKNIGPSVSPSDVFFYGKENTKNNPKGADDFYL